MGWSPSSTPSPENSWKKPKKSQLWWRRLWIGNEVICHTMDLYLPFWYWHLCFHPPWHDINFVWRHVLSCPYIAAASRMSLGPVLSICLHFIVIPSRSDGPLTRVHLDENTGPMSVSKSVNHSVVWPIFLAHSHEPSLSRWLDYQIKLSATNDDEQSEKLSTAVPVSSDRQIDCAICIGADLSNIRNNKQKPKR